VKRRGLAGPAVAVRAGGNREICLKIPASMSLDNLGGGGGLAGGRRKSRDDPVCRVEQDLCSAHILICQAVLDVVFMQIRETRGLCIRYIRWVYAVADCFGAWRPDIVGWSSKRRHWEYSSRHNSFVILHMIFPIVFPARWFRSGVSMIL
jgi:hypothetical protein